MSGPTVPPPRSAPPGWYEAPGEQGLARFWDGSRWTDARQPLPPPADARPVAGMAAPSTPVSTAYPGVTGPTGAPADSPEAAAFRMSQRAEQIMSVTNGLAASRVARTAGRVASLGTGLGMLFFATIWLVVCFAILKPLIWDTASPGDGEASTTGTVVDQHSHRDSDGDRLCSPEATFVVDGQPYVAGTSGSSSDCPAVGATVTVIYDVANPADSHVAPSKTMQMMFLIFPVFGFLALGISLWVIARSLGLGRLVRKLRRPRDDDAVVPARDEPPVIWNP